MLQDQPTNYNVNHASNGTWNNILLRVPSFWQQQRSSPSAASSSSSTSSSSIPSWIRRQSEYHVQSHQARNFQMTIYCNLIQFFDSPF